MIGDKMRYKIAKVKPANCGASVKAAQGGYMSVSGNGIDVNKLKKPKAGYAYGGYAASYSGKKMKKKKKK